MQKYKNFQHLSHFWLHAKTQYIKKLAMEVEKKFRKFED